MTCAWLEFARASVIPKAVTEMTDLKVVLILIPFALCTGIRAGNRLLPCISRATIM